MRTRRKSSIQSVDFEDMIRCYYLIGCKLEFTEFQKRMRYSDVFIQSSYGFITIYQEKFVILAKQVNNYKELIEVQEIPFSIRINLN